jgi:hypothetical protein
MEERGKRLTTISLPFRLIRWRGNRPGALRYLVVAAKDARIRLRTWASSLERLLEEEKKKRKKA